MEQDRLVDERKVQSVLIALALKQQYSSSIVQARKTGRASFILLIPLRFALIAINV